MLKVIICTFNSFEFFSITYRICTHLKYILFVNLTNRGIQNRKKNKSSMCRSKVISSHDWRKRSNYHMSYHVLANNFWSTHRTFVFLPVLDSSIGQLSKKYILHHAILSISYRKKLASDQSQPRGCSTIGKNFWSTSSTFNL